MGQTPVVGFFRRIWSHFGFNKEADNKRSSADLEGGFGVKIHVAAKPISTGPVVSQCSSGNGGVQGLKWYSEKLCSDEDGDVAEEFFHEPQPETLGEKTSGLEATVKTNPVKLKGPVCTFDGNVYQFVETSGVLQRA
ncbi:hypothetical protein O6H91_21G027700 [Diphasiastrum complanatum]|uniref:Uncharacterized protein n=1 Tax=Diphasiastrum complanatum TaxID=34168 RepID=A0ACC2AIY2_DIPCM|nr:hypothetical protein O6H91_21G027700 [Diphasiastrum complanatum]